ncbi:MAG: TrkH family potassium uptake protein [Lachnospiraceae bacterium]
MLDKFFGKLTSQQVIIYSFAGMILLGSLLLMLPISSADGTWTPWIDALFTSTSASCVTGLVVYDTATHWSLFGQFIILLLIQIGGLGVVTIAFLLTVLSGSRITLRQRGLLKDSISGQRVGGIIRMSLFLIRWVVIFEAAGAVALMPVFVRDFGWGRGIWYSIFHSVSAFCNAGFDLMGIRTQFSSLTAYQADPVVNITVMALIVIGGLGFYVWKDISDHRFRFGRCSLQTKLVLITTLILIVVPGIWLTLTEYGDLPASEALLSGFFQSVTTRTAGFNTADLTTLSGDNQLLMIVLMLIGGSPGSTAGGMKTTTAAVLILTMFAVFRRRQNVSVFHRRISSEVVRTACAILTMYLTSFLLAAGLISRLEGIPILTTAFEAASALGTVGLTLGITPTLGTISHVILICLMYMGRVGGLTIMYATINEGSDLRYPEEPVSVG